MQIASCETFLVAYSYKELTCYVLKETLAKNENLLSMRKLMDSIAVSAEMANHNFSVTLWTCALRETS